MTVTDEILRSNARVHRVCELTLIDAGAIFVASTALGVWLGVLIAGHAAPWAVLAVPVALDATAVAGVVIIQGRAVRRHKALCDAMEAAWRT